MHIYMISLFREASVNVNDKAVMSLQTVSLFLLETWQKKKNNPDGTLG